MRPAFAKIGDLFRVQESLPEIVCALGFARGLETLAVLVRQELRCTEFDANATAVCLRGVDEHLIHVEAETGKPSLTDFEQDLRRTLKRMHSDKVSGAKTFATRSNHRPPALACRSAKRRHETYELVPQDLGSPSAPFSTPHFYTFRQNWVIYRKHRKGRGRASVRFSPMKMRIRNLEQAYAKKGKNTVLDFAELGLTTWLPRQTSRVIDVAGKKTSRKRRNKIRPP